MVLYRAPDGTEFSDRAEYRKYLFLTQYTFKDRWVGTFCLQQWIELHLLCLLVSFSFVLRTLRAAIDLSSTIDINITPGVRKSAIFFLFAPKRTMCFITVRCRRTTRSILFHRATKSTHFRNVSVKYQCISVSVVISSAAVPHYQMSYYDSYQQHFVLMILPL